MKKILILFVVLFSLISVDISVRRNFTTALTAARPLPPEHL